MANLIENIIKVMGVEMRIKNIELKKEKMAFGTHAWCQYWTEHTGVLFSTSKHRRVLWSSLCNSRVGSSYIIIENITCKLYDFVVTLFINLRWNVKNSTCCFVHINSRHYFLWIDLLCYLSKQHPQPFQTWSCSYYLFNHKKSSETSSTDLSSHIFFSLQK